MNEAALLAVRRDSNLIEAHDVEEALDGVLVGLARRSRSLADLEKRVIAIHEAGHAVVAHLLPHAQPVHRISILPRGSAGGHTRLVSDEDRHIWSRSELCDAIAFIMGGLAAEELVFGESSTGSASDLAEATAIARRMVCQFGMSRELGPMALEAGEDRGWHQTLSDQTRGSGSRDEGPSGRGETQSHRDPGTASGLPAASCRAVAGARDSAGRGAPGSTGGNPRAGDSQARSVTGGASRVAAVQLP